jgi:hypothetical protein
MPQRISALSACLVVALLSSLHVLAQTIRGRAPVQPAGDYYPTLNSNSARNTHHLNQQVWRFTSERPRGHHPLESWNSGIWPLWGTFLTAVAYF